MELIALCLVIVIVTMDMLHGPQPLASDSQHVVDNNNSTYNSGDEIIKKCFANAGINVSNLFLRSTAENEASLSSDSNIASYTHYNYQWNQYGGSKSPLGYFIPETTAEIQAAVTCGRKLGIRVVPKCGGHSFAKYSFGDANSLVIDLHKLNEIMFDDEKKTCIVGPGALIGEVAWKLWDEAKKVLPLGSCPSVGISNALSGGDGALTRLHGLTLDNIIELEMIDLNGTLITANNECNSELFWALRGAGSGSFGIVTKYKFKLRDAPETILYSTRVYKLSSFPQVFYAWQLLFLSNPSKTINSAIHLNNNKIVVQLYEIQDDSNKELSIEESELYKILEKFPPCSSSKSSSSPSITKLTYPEFLMKFYAFFGVQELKNVSNLTSKSTKPTYFKAKSFFVNMTVEHEKVQTLYSELTGIPSKNIFIDMYAAGGAINEIATTDTAYIHRANIGYSVQLIYDGFEPNSTELSKGLDWIRNFFNLTQLIMKHVESYQNYIDEDLEDYLQRYYGENVERLVGVKRLIDPENYFWNPQSIPTELN